MWKRAPLPGSLSTVILPPWFSIVRCDVERPKPWPSCLVVNMNSNIRPRCSRLIPGPLSWTSMDAVCARLSGRSVALYVSTPSNPTGRVLPRTWLEALAELARREDLWLLSDEVYEDYVYRGEHC